jgi:hypothetical protein
MTMTAWRVPLSSGIPLTQEPTPQLQHIRDHLRGALGRSTILESSLDEHMAVVRFLTEPMAFDEIAEKLGEGWTERMVETRYVNVCNALCLGSFMQRGRGGGGSSIQLRSRIALTRQVYGIDRCWCDF